MTEAWATVLATGVTRARYTMRDVAAVCAVDGAPFACDVEIAFVPSGATLELGWLRETVNAATRAPTTAEGLAAWLKQQVKMELPDARRVRVRVEHGANRDGVRLVVEA